MRTYRRLISYARPFSRFAPPFFVFSILSIVFGVFQFTLVIPLLDVLFGTVESADAAPLTKPEFALSVEYLKDIFGYYFRQIINQHGKFRALQFVCGTIVASVLLSNLFRYLAERIIQDVRTYSVYRLREAVFDKFTSLHLKHFTNERKGDLLSRITSDVQEIENTAASTLTVMFKEPYSLIALVIALFLISTRLALFSLLVIPVSGVIISAITKSLRKKATAGQESISRLTSIIDETLGGIRIIKSFNAVAYIREKFRRENQTYRKTTRSIGNRRELAAPFSEVAGIMVVAGILLYGGNLILRQESELKASEFIVYIGIFSQVLRPAKAITSALSNIQRGIAAGERVLAVIDTPEEVTEQPDAVELKNFSQGIRFEQVTFSYGGSPVLKNVSFQIPKGKTVALVGQSGSGKSTIADLIPRFYDVSAGSILLDGQDIRTYTLHSLREQMGIVTQESILFNDTIFNNIAFGKPDAREADIIRAAKIANAHDFIMQTENGYRTLIGDRGAKLSGGQRQRLSIARAIFKNPPILILDEATSALDTESERLVQEALSNLMKDRTALVIAHRLSTIQHADEIIVMHQGEIVERGNHGNLMEVRDGVYKKLSTSQML